MFGISWHKLPGKQVHAICTTLGVKGVKQNVKKSAMIEVLVKWCYSRKVYNNTREKLGLTTNDEEEEEPIVTTTGGVPLPRTGKRFNGHSFS